MLSLGPKFAMEPKTTAPELLSFVRQVSRWAPEAEMARCTSEGVDLLYRHTPQRTMLPVKKIESYLVSQSLSLVPADKEGGFVIMPRDVFGTKAVSAIDSVFQRNTSISLTKVKSVAKKLCSELELKQLCFSIDRSRNLSLDLFFQRKNS